MFKIGDKVVCIHDGPWSSVHPKPYNIKKGRVYTIRDIGPPKREHMPFIIDDGETDLVVWLEEVMNCGPSHIIQIDVGYRIQRFRKVQKKKTDISIFHRIRENVERNAPIYSTIPPEELGKTINASVVQR